ncbi:hypothetical protein Tco_0252426 [Tanacetum coccineum]
MEPHIAPKSPVQLNKIASSCEIFSAPHDTQYCMENPKQAFVDYASSRTDEAGDARLSKFEADFKQQHGEMSNKIDTFLKAINDRMTRALPSDTVKNPKLNVNSTSSVLSARSYPMEDPQCSSREQNKNFSSPKRVHFINTITIINKEDEPRETGIVKPDTKDNDHDAIIKVEEGRKESEGEGKEEKDDP